MINIEISLITEDDLKALIDIPLLKGSWGGVKPACTIMSLHTFGCYGEC